MSSTRLQRTAQRRMRHRSRSAASSLLLGVTALGAAYVAVEATLALLELPALLVAPQDAAAALADDDRVAGLIVVAAALIALVAIVLAVRPGTLARRALTDERAAILADDAVIASGLSSASARVAGVDRSQVRTRLGRGRAVISITPSTGFLIDRGAVLESAERLLADLAPTRPIRARVEIADQGVLR